MCIRIHIYIYIYLHMYEYIYICIHYTHLCISRCAARESATICVLRNNQYFKYRKGSWGSSHVLWGPDRSADVPGRLGGAQGGSGGLGRFRRCPGWAFEKPHLRSCWGGEFVNANKVFKFAVVGSFVIRSVGVLFVCFYCFSKLLLPRNSGLNVL